MTDLVRLMGDAIGRRRHLRHSPHARSRGASNVRAGRGAGVRPPRRAAGRRARRAVALIVERGGPGVGVVIDSPHEPVHDQDATKA